MKAFSTGAALALALALTACGDEGDSTTNAAAGNAAAPAAPLEQVEAPNGDWSQMVSETPEGGFRMGNPNAPVKLVEYASVTCPHCAEFSEAAAEPLVNQYVKSGQVSWEFRHFLLFPTDLGVSMLVRCQGAQPFFRLTDQLYAGQQQWVSGVQNIPAAEQERIGALPPAQRTAAIVKAGGIDTFFRQRGMPQSRIDSCLADQAAMQRLVEITDNAARVEGVQGTPTFFINGEKVEDAASWGQLEPALREAIG